MGADYWSHLGGLASALFVYIFSRGLIDPAQLSHFVNLTAHVRVHFGKQVKDTVQFSRGLIDPTEMYNFVYIFSRDLIDPADMYSCCVHSQP